VPPALDWVTTRAREVAQSRTPLQEQAGNTKLNQVQEEMERLNRWSGKDYEGPLDPSPQTDPRNPSTNLDDWLPASVRSATKEVEELMDELDRDGWTPDDAFE